METSSNIYRQSRKAWTIPQLTTHGTVEEITAQDKKFGGSDGFTLLGVPIPIQNNS